MVSFGLCVLALCAAALPASQPDAVYRARREHLRKDLPEGVTVLFGRTEKDNDDLRSGFFQEPNFYYLTGWLEPGAILLLAPLPADRDSPGYGARSA
ncbi:MAG TPA: aminopeptidase P N-terminal domain-containing protein, partial [Bryobacteraceae bacterium]|nr:aminopeptidase P N-terminal domain-containing protein [Bryobacteraceae bacterium]